MAVKKPTALCPECDMKVTLHKTPRLGQIVVCHTCDTTLEVAQVSPLELDWASEDPFDEDDEHFEYEDEDTYFDEVED